MRPVGIRQTIDGSRRRVFPAFAAAVLVLVFALALGACGGDTETTTTTAGQPHDTTTTTLAGGLTPITEPAGGDTTTVSFAEEETTTTGAGPADETTVTTQGLSAGEEVLPDGHIRVMGFVKSVREKDAKRYVTVDYAEMLSGNAAIEAARDAGDIGPDEDLPNDYYISNPSTDKHEFEVSAGVAITTSSWHGEMNKTVSWDEFMSFWSVSPADEDASFLRDSPWWLERDGQTVVKIDEQYLP